MGTLTLEALFAFRRLWCPLFSCLLSNLKNLGNSAVHLESWRCWHYCAWEYHRG